MNTTRVEILQVLAELSTIFPDWRLGQMVANVAGATPNGTQEGALWDCEDEEMLVAARRLLERNRHRLQASA